jgi:hypothetical protein
MPQGIHRLNDITIFRPLSTPGNHPGQGPVNKTGKTALAALQNNP